MVNSMMSGLALAAALVMSAALTGPNTDVTLAAHVVPAPTDACQQNQPYELNSPCDVAKQRVNQAAANQADAAKRAKQACAQSVQSGECQRLRHDSKNAALQQQDAMTQLRTTPSGH